MKKILFIFVMLISSVASFAQQVIQGAFLNGGQVAMCVLMYNNGQITHIATTKDYTGNYDWQSIYPDNPHPTNSYQDSQMYRSYNYKISAGSTTIYFNLNNTSRSYGGNSGGYSNRSYGNSGGYGNSEKILQGMFIDNRQQNIIVLKYNSGKITHYATSKGYNGYNWQSMYPDNPHPTNSYEDGNIARSYNYKVSVQGTTVYFNM